MNEKISEYFKKHDVVIVPNVGMVDDTYLDRSFQYVRDTNGVDFSFELFAKEMDRVFLREHAKYVSFEYTKRINPMTIGDRHFIRMNWNDGRDEITKRNDEFYDNTKSKINDLLYDEYGNKKIKVLKKDMLKLLEELL